MGDDPDLVARERVSDWDRDQAVAELRAHLGEGRLSAEELSERVERALAARTRGDLDAVLADLPSARLPVPEGPRPHETGWTVGIMASSVRRGRWRPRPRTNVVSVMGSCTLDLRQADLDGPELVIHAVAVMGEVEIVVPEGIEVDVSGIPIMGEKSLDIRPAPVRRGSPRVLVRAVPVMGSVVVRSRPAPGSPADERGALGPGSAPGSGQAPTYGGRSANGPGLGLGPPWEPGLPRRAALRQIRHELRQQRRATWGLPSPAGDSSGNREDRQ